MDTGKLDIKDFKNIRVFKSKFEQFNFIFDKSLVDGLILEFGVYKGTTINYIAKHFKNETIYGFDSFIGLPEDWDFDNNTLRHKDRFKLDSIPNDLMSNITLYEGFFEKTIPLWKEKHKENIKFLHIDCDIYSSTKTVLNSLNDQIVSGTIIVFDELLENNNYKFWYKHEWKALQEWIKEFNREIVPLSKTKYSSAIKVIK